MTQILVVDDDQMIRRLLVEILTSRSYSCVSAADAAEARQTLANRQFDLILCDINMPGESGLDFARYVVGAHRQAAVVMITGVDDPMVADAALEIGVYDYLTKPLEKNRVLICAANALHRCRLEAENLVYKEGLEELVQSRTAMLEDAVRELEQTKQALQQSERNYRELVQNANSFILRMDVQGRITFFNEYAQRFFGYTEDEILGQKAVGTITPETESNGRDLSGLIEDISRDPEKYSSNDNENITRSGERVWVTWTNKAVFDENGQMVEILSIGNDITARKLAEDARKQSEKRFRELIEGSIQGILIHRDHKPLFVNQTWASIHGYTPEEILKMDSVVPLMSPNDQERMVRYKNARKKGEYAPAHYEYQAIRKDGSPIWLENRVMVVLWEGEAAIQSIIVDITDRKLAEEALLESEDRFRTIATSAKDAIIMMDSDGKVSYWNAAAEKMFGYPEPDAMNKVLHSLISPRRYHDEFRKNFSRFRETGRGPAVSNMIELTAIRHNGGEFPIELSLSAMKLKGSWHALGIVRDISERRILESQLVQAQKLESIGQLAAGIAHEINTPIQYVSYNTRFLKEQFSLLNPLFDKYLAMCDAVKASAVPDDMMTEIDAMNENIDLNFMREEIPAAIEQTLEGVERVSEIVRAMKEFSHPGTEDKTSIEINKAIQSTITVARNEWKYVAEVETDFDADLPLVPCLPGDFNQVILNLIVNAAHAIADVVGDGTEEKGLISIQTRRTDGWAEIRVSDTGTGIAEENRGRIFDPFFTTKEVGRGTGQGMAICHSVITERHAGKISFDTEIGKGTTFLIQLPFEETAS